MTTLTVRNLEDWIRDALRVRAAQNGRSMEAEVREILRKEAVKSAPKTPGEVVRAIHETFKEVGGWEEFEQPPRPPAPEPINFDQ